MSARMPLPDIPAVLARAESAVETSAATRADQRRRRRPDRVEALLGALEALDSAMSEVRPLVHASARRPIPRELELRTVSDSIQRERRKLRKMLTTTANRSPVIGLEGGWSA